MISSCSLWVHQWTKWVSLIVKAGAVACPVMLLSEQHIFRPVGSPTKSLQRLSTSRKKFRSCCGQENPATIVELKIHGEKNVLALLHSFDMLESSRWLQYLQFLYEFFPWLAPTLRVVFILRLDIAALIAVLHDGVTTSTKKRISAFLSLSLLLPICRPPYEWMWALVAAAAAFAMLFLVWRWNHFKRAKKVRYHYTLCTI